MIHSFLYRIVNSVARSIKGGKYSLDSSIPITGIIGVAFSRFVRWGRSILMGYSFKKRVFIGRGVELRNRRKIRLGCGVTLGDFVRVDGLSKDGVDLGDHVNIGDYTRIEASGTITNIGCGIKIGDNSGIGSFSFIGGAGGVSIGRDVIMGQWVSFHPENHNTSSIELPIRLQGVNRRGIVVGDNCWFGAKVTILDGVNIGSGSIIAAGAVVTAGKYPDNAVLGGVPAKIIKYRG